MTIIRPHIAAQHCHVDLQILALHRLAKTPKELSLAALNSNTAIFESPFNRDSFK
jgi:hypothetical protein